MKILINNSLVEIKALDDAISSGTPELADVEINNSRVFAETGNDAIDSNGTIHINGSIYFGIGHNWGSRGCDCDSFEFKIGPETILVSVGMITSSPTVKLLEHPACLAVRSQNTPEFCVTEGNQNLIHFTTPTFNYKGAGYKVLLSLPEFKKDVEYDFCDKATVKPKHTFHGLSIGGTVTDKTIKSSRTFVRNYTTV